MNKVPLVYSIYIYIKASNIQFGVLFKKETTKFKVIGLLTKKLKEFEKIRQSQIAF